MRTFMEPQMKKLLSWRPNKNRCQIRLYVAMCILANSGIRISEGLSLTLENIDWDYLIIKVTGKGSKQRIVPIRIELRDVLHRYVKKQRFSKFPGSYLLYTSTGMPMGYNNIKREFDPVIEALEIEGFDAAFHAFRRFFVKNCLKNGGNLVDSQRLFGHRDLTTTKMYLEDIVSRKYFFRDLDQLDLSRLRVMVKGIKEDREQASPPAGGCFQYGCHVSAGSSECRPCHKVIAPHRYNRAMGKYFLSR